MKTTTLKNALLTASLLAAAGYSATAPAHTLNFKSLGKGAKATDTYEVTCSTDGGGTSYRLVAEVRDDAPVAAPSVSVQIIKGSVASNATDSVDGDGNYSPAASVTPNPANPNGGNGVYYVLVNKTKAGAENYSLEFHCLSSTGSHTGTSVVARQNQ